MSSHVLEHHNPQKVYRILSLIFYGGTYTPIFPFFCHSSIARPWTSLWLSLPATFRLRAYWGLSWLGVQLYGKTAPFIQRLPFGLYLKRERMDTLTRTAFGNIYVAMNTTIPVPTVLDVVDNGKNSLMLMTSLPGNDLVDAIEKGEISEESFEETMRDWFAQLRNLTPPDPTRVCSIDGGPCRSFRVTPDPFGPFPDVHSFHERVLRTCPVNEWERLETIVPKSFDKPHRVVFSHGDLHISNILVHNGSPSGLIDWECAGWYPEYWDYTIAIYHIKRLPFWVNSLSRIFPEYAEELEVEKEMWKVNCPW